MKTKNPALSALRHHVSGAIERGEKTAIVEQPAAGEAGHLFTLREVPALDGSGATAHELETSGHTVAHVYPDTGEDFAAFIVRACNSHAGLLAALADILPRYESAIRDSGNGQGKPLPGETVAIERAKAALQSAKE